MTNFKFLLAYLFYRFLVLFWRVRHVEHPKMTEALQNKVPVVFAHWHRDTLVLAHLIGVYKLTTMVSPSYDGARASYIAHQYGGKTIRGSSSRGAISALKALVRACKNHEIVSLAVDGPRGPIYVPKPGIFEVSKLCNAVIVPIGVSPSSAFVFKKSWDKTYVPKPFSKIGYYFGEPLPPVGKDQDPKDLELQERLSKQLAAAEQQAAKLIAGV